MKGRAAPLLRATERTRREPRPARAQRFGSANATGIQRHLSGFSFLRHCESSLWWAAGASHPAFFYEEHARLLHQNLRAAGFSVSLILITFGTLFGMAGFGPMDAACKYEGMFQWFSR